MLFGWMSAQRRLSLRLDRAHHMLLTGMHNAFDGVQVVEGDKNRDSDLLDNIPRHHCSFRAEQHADGLAQ